MNRHVDENDTLICNTRVGLTLKFISFELESYGTPVILSLMLKT